MFNINNARDRLHLLKADYTKLKADPLNISLAEKACSDAWHLSDWVFIETQETNGNLTKETFRIDLYNECPVMRILHDLANKAKHKKLDRPKASIKKTSIHKGGFSSEFSKAYNVSRLEVHFDDGAKIDLDDLVKLAIDYWSQKLTD